VKLAETSVRRPVTVLMLVFVVIILGFVSFTKIPLDLMPEFELPIAVVSTSYSGVGPQEIESLVTKPVEQALATVPNLDSLNSVSSEGSSIVLVTFNFGVDMDQASLDMREKLDMVKAFLPEDAGDPMVFKMDMNAMPILMLAVSSDDMSLAEMQALAEDKIQPRLERTEGVASVSISGGTEQVIEIRTKSEALAGYGISVSYLQGILAAENLNLPGGTVRKGSQELAIKTKGEFDSVEEIKQLIIPLPTGASVQLQDVADVELIEAEQATISKVNGDLGIAISIQKQSGSNTVRVSEAVLAEVEKIKKELPHVEINIIQDSAEYIKDSLKQVAQNGLTGALLAIIVLYIFLRNIRTTLIIATSIPISIIATFCLLYFSNITLNLMTLGGLMLGIGRLVDDSVVVLENIYRFRQQGYSRFEAAVKGCSEVIVAVMAATLTTVAVFIPIVFVEGLTSTIFRQFALTIAFSLGASLVVSVTLVPMLSSKLLKVDRSNGEDSPKRRRFGFLSKLHDKFDHGYQGLVNAYKDLLAWALDHRRRVIVITTLISVLAIASIALVGAEFLPETDEGMISIDVRLPDGAEVESTVEIMDQIEGLIADIPEIDTVFMNAGSGGYMSMSMSSGGNRGSFYVLLTPLEERNRRVDVVIEEIREKVKDVAGAKISIAAAQTMSMTGADISLTIKGEDLDRLKEIGDDFVEIIRKVPGTREVKSSYEEGIPEVVIDVNRDVASQYGLTAGSIATAVRSTVSGVTATRYSYRGNEIDVRILGDESFKQNIKALEQIPISTNFGFPVTLGEVADISVERGPISISRDNQVRTITVSCQISGRDIASVAAEIQQSLSQYPLEDTYSYSMGGEQEEMVEAFSDLFLALGLAVILVYMVMASQFESLIHPFIIMFSIPVGFAGATLGLFFTGNSLNVMSIIGFIMLAGIVVSNAIVLVDYINVRRRDYNDSVREAILKAGPIRLRPILMTTLTTVIAMFPLSLGIGEGAELQAPMAVAIVTGLLFSTLVTLVLVPVLYSIAEDYNARIRKRFGLGKAKKEAVPVVSAEQAGGTGLGI
jgi:HAE1 family hydrophobic/amphiphilic exporter-1